MKSNLSVFLAALAAVVLLQWGSGAYQSEFGGHPDEAAHYITGLMMRDYMAAGFPGSPMSYAKDYYEHYPKIGLGVWPPVFYMAQSAWTLLLPISRGSLMALMAVLTAGLSLLLWRSASALSGRIVAGALIVVLLGCELVQRHSTMVMAEMLSALWMFSAVLAFGEFLDKERGRWAIAFGALASMAILTKGTGLALALVPPLGLLLAGKPRLAKHPCLWGAAGLVLLLAGPWTFMTKDLGKGGWLAPSPNLAFSLQAAPYYIQKLSSALGWPVLLLALVGIATLRKTSLPGRSAACAGLVVNVWAFQSIAPVGLEARHLIPALPAAILLAGVGWTNLTRKIPVAGRIGMGVVVIAFALFSAQLPKTSFGFAPAAERILKEQGNSPVLVSSDATGEGMFIAEMASRDPDRPSFLVQRASKVLASSQWSGSDYKPRFETGEALGQFLATGQYRFLLVDDSLPKPKRTAHHKLFESVLNARPETFRLLGTFPIQRNGQPQAGNARLFEVVTP